MRDLTFRYWFSEYNFATA